MSKGREVSFKDFIITLTVRHLHNQIGDGTWNLMIFSQALFLQIIFSFESCILYFVLMIWLLIVSTLYDLLKWFLYPYGFLKEICFNLCFPIFFLLIIFSFQNYLLFLEPPLYIKQYSVMVLEYYLQTFFNS